MADQKPSDKGKPARSGGRADASSSERTQPLPKYQKVLDEHFTNWPREDDNDAAGGGQ